MAYYKDKGYPTEAVIEALMTIINSNYEEWHTQNPDKKFYEFIYSPKKMSSSGAFFDLDKLDNISRNIISKMTKDEVYDNLYNWAKEYNENFASIISKDISYTKSILNIEREQKKPRKDYAYYSDIENQIWYMFPELFDKHEKVYEWGKINNISDIKEILNEYFTNYYSKEDDKDTWFNKVKELSDKIGYCTDMKAYKENPDNYKGSVADVSTVIRVAVTTKSMTPDLYEILNLLSNDEINRRISLIK